MMGWQLWTTIRWYQEYNALPGTIKGNLNIIVILMQTQLLSPKTQMLCQSSFRNILSFGSPSNKKQITFWHSSHRNLARKLKLQAEFPVPILSFQMFYNQASKLALGMLPKHWKLLPTLSPCSVTCSTNLDWTLNENFRNAPQILWVSHFSHSIWELWNLQNWWSDHITKHSQTNIMEFTSKL